MTIDSVERIYHTEKPPTKRRRKKNTDASPDEYKRRPEELNNLNLRNHLCEPWVGCHRCTVICSYGKEYMRRVAAGEIVPLGEGEYMRRTIR